MAHILWGLGKHQKPMREPLGKLHLQGLVEDPTPRRGAEGFRGLGV